MREDKLYLKLLLDKVVQHDDEQSFAKLFKLFYSRLVSFSRNYVQRQELAEEAVSDVFVKTWNNRKSLANVSDITAYLYTAVRNQSLNYVRAHPHSFIEISETEDLNLSALLEEFDPEKELEVGELVHSIRIAVDSLPDQCKTVFKLIKEDGFRYKQVADILKISPRTVETQLVRALKRLEIALVPFVARRKSRTSKPPEGGGLRSFLLSFFL